MCHIYIRAFNWQYNTFQWSLQATVVTSWWGLNKLVRALIEQNMEQSSPSSKNLQFILTKK